MCHLDDEPAGPLPIPPRSSEAKARLAAVLGQPANLELAEMPLVDVTRYLSTVVNVGQWQLRNDRGDLLVDGQYKNGVPTSLW